MTLTYRSDKGAPLTANEIDDNFRELEIRLHALENHEPHDEKEGAQLSFPFLPLYDKAHVPKEAKRGTLALLQKDEGLSLIFFNGITWQNIEKGDIK